MITLDNVTKSYNDGHPNEVHAVRSVSLSLPLDQTTVFKGPSGSGKTTLLSLIGCLARPTTGRIYLKEELISGLPEKFMTDIRRQTFGFHLPALQSHPWHDGARKCHGPGLAFGARSCRTQAPGP